MFLYRSVSLSICIYMCAHRLHPNPRLRAPRTCPQLHGENGTQLARPQPPAAGSGLGATGYRLCSAEPALAAGAVPERPCAVARRPLSGIRGTAAPSPRGGRCPGRGPGAGAAPGGGSGAAGCCSAPQPAGWRTRNPALSEGAGGFSPAAAGAPGFSCRGPPAQLPLLVSVARQRRGGANARYTRPGRLLPPLPSLAVSPPLGRDSPGKRLIVKR